MSKQLPEEFLKAAPVIQKLEDHGYEAYFVGGSVRDIMMDHKIHDVDIATSAYPSEVQEIFKHTIDVGIEHGTVLVLWDDEQYEVTTFRTESTYQDYRRPDHVTFVRSLEEDLKRRDFRMNALAMTQSGDVIDLFNGIKDIQQHQICAVGDAYERFHEDALRMMRALRFSSQLDFTIEPKTYQAIIDNHQLLKKISVERIQIEWLKMMAGKNPKRGLKAFIETDCYKSCPMLDGQKDALISLYQRVNQPLTEAQTWLCLSFVLNLTPDASKKLFQQWKCSNEVKHLVSSSLPYLYLRKDRIFNDWELYQLGLERLELIESVLFLYSDVKCDKEYEVRYNQLPIHQVGDLDIDGKQLMASMNKPAGPWLGKTIKALQQAVINQEIHNQFDDLIQYARKMEENNEGI